VDWCGVGKDGVCVWELIGLGWDSSVFGDWGCEDIEDGGRVRSQAD
jgi:hypothetical protein